MAEGIGAGDEVITTPYTFFATAGCIARVGARPVFVDIEPESFNLDSDAIEERITDRTRAILPVHLYGRAAEMAPIMEIARRRGLVVIEDAAQAIGAESHGRRVGAIGDYGCFSFYPSKNLAGFGDGGAVTVADEDRLHRLRVLRNHGMDPKYFHPFIGGNFRLDALQAAALRVKLPHLDRWTEQRRQNADRYDRLFRDAGLAGDPVGLPARPAADSRDRHVWNQYVIRVPHRDALRQFLAEQEVGTEVYYPLPLHLQECFQPLGCREGDFPESEHAARETLALPIYPELADDQAEWVVESIGRFYAHLPTT
jgi:dTDP-4-amino-4,6-dideoxygalactose transaminase